MQNAPVPHARWSEVREWSQSDQTGRCAIISTHAAAITLSLYNKMPVGSSLGCAMMITKEAERVERECEGCATCLVVSCAMQRVLHVGGVLPIFHPDALFERKRIFQDIAEARHIALKRKSVEVSISLWVNGAILVLIYAQFDYVPIGKLKLFIYLRYHHCTIDRGMQRCYQQAMIAACGSPNNRTTCV